MEKIPSRDAIALQPDVLEEYRTALAAVAAELRHRRPVAGSVATLGIGASYYAAIAVVRELWKLGVRATAIDAAELWQDDFDVADTYIAISASGESLETVHAVDRIRTCGKGFVVSVTSNPGGTLTSLVDLAVNCGAGRDSVPATVSYTATLQALALLVSAWASEREAARREAAWAAVPEVVTGLIDAIDARVDEVAAALAASGAIDFVATQQALASAAEGALLYREAARIPCAWFGSRFYLHGPMEPLEAGRGIVIVGDGSDEGIATIRRQASRTGCVAVQLAPAPTVELTSLGGVATLELPTPAGRLIDTIYETVALQVLACRSAEHRRLESGTFRYPQPQVKVH